MMVALPNAALLHTKSEETNVEMGPQLIAADGSAHTSGFFIEKDSSYGVCSYLRDNTHRSSRVLALPEKDLSLTAWLYMKSYAHVTSISHYRQLLSINTEHLGLRV